MNKRTIIIFIFIALFLSLGGTYWYFLQKGALPDGLILFPGESGSKTETPGTQEETTPEENPGGLDGAETKLPRLYQLHPSPVAGLGFFEERDKKGVVLKTSIRYIEKGVGHIFETPIPVNATTYEERRIVNETRPRISEALWGNNGNSVVIRFLETTEGEVIKTRIINTQAPLADSFEFLNTEELYLPDSIPFMATAGDGSNNLFYLEGEDGFLSNYKNLGSADIFSSVFTEWLPQFPSQKIITLTSRPSEKVPGHMFFLDPKTGSVTKILGNINGLTTLTNKGGEFVLFSESKNSTPDLLLYDVSKKTTLPTYLLGLPEKCVWGTKVTSLVYCAIPEVLTRASYPDQWYQGVVSFSDSLWEINSTTLETRRVFTPKDLKAPPLDMINLSLSSDDSFLAFIDKTTGTPWIYSIVEPKPVAPVVTETPTQSPATSSPIISTTTVSTTTKTSVAPSVITSDMQKLK